MFGILCKYFPKSSPVLGEHSMNDITTIHNEYCMEQYEKKRFLPPVCKICGKPGKPLYITSEASFSGLLCPECLIHSLCRQVPDILLDFLTEHTGELESVLNQYYCTAPNQDAIAKEGFSL
jgi:hypothetical protein